MKKNNPKSPKRKDKKYIPSKGTNPEMFSRRISMLNDKIDKNNQLSEMKEQALYEYIALMTNFASHDLKNAIHNLDGYVNTMDLSNVTQENIEMINEYLSNIRKTIQDFRTLAPDKSKNEFCLKELGKSIELLNRGLLSSKGITATYSYDRNSQIIIKQSLHNVIQMVNNLILNSSKALSDIERKALFVSINIVDKEVVIKVCDNGIGIKESNRERIFNLHFSTTGGSGIGLAHAKFIIDSMGGSIQYIGRDDKYNTIFLIKFPIYEQSVDINN